MYTPYSLCENRGMENEFEPVVGLHERLITTAVDSVVSNPPEDLATSIIEVDNEDAGVLLAQHLANVILHSFKGIRGAEAILRKTDLANSIVDAIIEKAGKGFTTQQVADPLRQLLKIATGGFSSEPSRPDTPLGFSSLITGSPNDPSLGSQLRKETASCDHLDILCSFIRWSGLRLIMDELRRAGEAQPSGSTIRVITTSYMGATDPRAIEALLTIPNLELKVSYDTQRTRLHAKAYLFHRRSGFGSAYVGSANLSNAALSDGLEWTTKISQYELPHLWRQLNATFDAYWNDLEFKTIKEKDLGHFREAIEHERESPKSDGDLITFDIRPYPYQQEILDVLQAEREVQDKHKHLVVAATGTGKTMIAAFDFRNFEKQQAKRPTLLFIAHRQEILQQAIQSYRAVLRDHNFGELLVGNYQAEKMDHLFCSVQTFDSRDLHELGAKKWDYVVVDEFHHASAKTYSKLLENLQPKVLLGLTATPERADGQDILKWFDGEASTQIRLADAINRRLLSPFQYFGVSDSDNASLEHIEWQRGGYKVSDLENIYNGNDIRAQLIVDKIHEYLANPKSVRALVFCVSVAHAKFMESFMSSRGLKTTSVCGDTKDEDRRQIKRKLIEREVNFVCVVDLYNEGVDIREVDTVLFLRPTESLTVFLQQLGRGLRLHDNKDCLTVLDFIGAHRKEFRFANRFRALSDDPAKAIDGEVKDDFPSVPSGCFIKLEKVAKQRVLDNIRQNIRLTKSRFLNELKLLAGHLSRTPKLCDAVNFFCDMEIDDILKKGLWSSLLFQAGLLSKFTAPNEREFKSSFRRLALVDDPTLIKEWLAYINRGAEVFDTSRSIEMFHMVMWGQASRNLELAGCHASFFENTSIVDDVRQLLEVKSSKPKLLSGNWRDHIPLQMHGEYGKSEILTALGHWRVGHLPRFTEGVLHLKNEKADAFFVDLNKSANQYSPTTMYDDYIISDTLFHWQSQSTTSESSPTGKRYIDHKNLGYTPLLFVRGRKKLKSDLTSPFVFLGPCEYFAHEGSRPISFTWKLANPIPARLLRLKTQAAG